MNSITFDALAPGLMVFAILLLISYTASTLAREVEQGTLHRYRLARVGAPSLLFGVLLAQLILASLAFALMLGVAHLMGFENQGSYAAAYVIILATALCSIGIGMGVAAIVKRRDEAANLAMFLAIPLGLLSGAFFEIPGVTLWEEGDRSLELYDLLPTTHAVDALQAIMNEGQGLGDVTTSLAALAAMAVATFLMGSLMFWGRRMTGRAAGATPA